MTWGSMLPGNGIKEPNAVGQRAVIPTLPPGTALAYSFEVD